jgi:hypothetical protein
VIGAFSLAANQSRTFMALDKTALFESTKALWPQTIFTLDARNTLNRIYEANEAAFSVDDNWRQVAMWAFHQALSALERQANAEEVATISPHTVPFEAFDKWMRFNLAKDKRWPDEWLEERTEWEAGDRS